MEQQNQEQNLLEELILEINQRDSQMPIQMVKNILKQIGFKSDDINSYKAIGILSQNFIEQIISEIENIQSNKNKKQEDKKLSIKQKSNQVKKITLKDLLDDFQDNGLNIYKSTHFPETDFE